MLAELSKAANILYEIIELTNEFYEKDRNFTKKVSTFSIKDINTVKTVSINNFKKDRIVPLDSVTKSEFEIRNEGTLENPVIEYGQNSDEYLRNNGLLALAIANRILIQSKAYKPENEDGRALLEHELTHVQQYSEQRIDSESKKKLENEAEKNEKQVIYNPDKLISKSINGKEYKLTEKKWKQINDDVVKEIEQWVEMQEHQMPEEEYYKLLIKFDEFEKNYQKTGEINWD